jgi:prepilin-type N-terminal cleavage/methylation domain-containing protein
MRPDTVRINSFSLVEMLVVLVLSGIVLSTLYFAYYSISTYQFTLARKSEQQEDLSLMFYTFKRDIEHCYILRMRNQHVIDCYNAPEQLGVSYYFDAPNVIRKQLERIDTFHCQIEEPLFFFRGASVIDENAVVDEIRLIENISSIPIELDINKLYDAASLINAIPNDTTREWN